EMTGLGSLILEAAAGAAVPAGSSLAVDRDQFAERVTTAIAGQPLIEVMREEVTAIPEGPAVIATGPLTSPALTAAISAISGESYLYFYDALAPIVTQESIDMSVAFRASRYDNGVQDDGDYINCPMNRAEYERFTTALLAAETIALRDFEQEDAQFFEGCMPVEVLAGRGVDALRYGPMRPKGLRDPRTGREPYAVVQLRQDNLAGSLFNLVGFQTNL
ncbi:MAG: methylenetetrahydrofolate--tRNA-(uracil(54)-C(5))-methyltransferase (FADH(2)-oxidizing) TrmFO, partial [Anaerolineales bacterium]|nr:methylenetetrahydrofolate--tRNA-(uracil(54)-C(5))-methyltransferase (FADH(2)-oxidizing) TrmFO [Anaerolineales bacterium]